MVTTACWLTLYPEVLLKSFGAVVLTSWPCVDGRLVVVRHIQATRMGMGETLSIPGSTHTWLFKPDAVDSRQTISPVALIDKSPLTHTWPSKHATILGHWSRWAVRHAGVGGITSCSPFRPGHDEVRGLDVDGHRISDGVHEDTMEPSHGMLLDQNRILAERLASKVLEVGREALVLSLYACNGPSSHKGPVCP